MTNLWLPQRGVKPGAQFRLFCFPHAGGGTGAYHRWSYELPPEIDVLPILLPGRERRIAEPAFRDLHQIVLAIVNDLSNLFDVPYALFGHSMGALVSFELCRELRRRGQRLPQQLVVAACRAPQRVYGPDLLHLLPDNEFISAMQSKFGGIPREIAANQDLLQMFLPTLRSDLTAVETYRYVEEAPLDCPLTALGGVGDQQVSAADLAAWQLQTTQRFSHKLFPGGHFFVTECESDVIRVTQRQLERA